jgi:glucose/arabinose dehydrogenase
MYKYLLLVLLALAACGPVASRPDQSTGRATSIPAAPTSVPADPQPTNAEPALSTATPAPAATAAPANNPPGVSAADPGTLTFALEPVVEGFTRPVHVTAANDGTGRLFVTEQYGAIWIVQNGQRLEEPFLDIRALVNANGNEQGLLSIAFHPQYAENGRFFVGYTARNGDNIVAAYRVSADPNRADHESAQVLLAVPDPAPNHNGGLVKFGPDGYLYVGMGDGGAAGDPWNNGQNLDSLLGKMLRLDVDNGEPYAIPADNPFVNEANIQPEIWALGLRNPWRFSFDRTTGDLYIADVGQNEYEEVHFQPANSTGGENYGWKIVEGAECFRAETCDTNSLVPPVAVYAHADPVGGCSITGGYVYRGSAFPQLNGTYLYSDYCTGNFWALRNVDGQWVSAAVAQFRINPSSFGEDEAGELYLTDRDGGGLYRLVVSG